MTLKRIKEIAHHYLNDPWENEGMSTEGVVCKAIEAALKEQAEQHQIKLLAWQKAFGDFCETITNNIKEK